MHSAGEEPCGLCTEGLKLIKSGNPDDREIGKDIARTHKVKASYSGYDARAFLGDGKGFFQRMEDFAAEKGPGYIVPGEFTGDKVMDLAISNQRDGSISILQGRGDGSFIFPHFNYPVGRNPRAMAGADFNKDGLTDLAVLLYDSASLEIFMRKIDSARIAS